MFKIGTAGTPAGSKGTLDALSKVKSLGLDAMELEFVRGVYLTEDSAKAVGESAKSLHLALTVHAPYYVNLNSNPETTEASIKRVIDSAKKGELASAFSVAFHPAYRQGTPASALHKIVGERIKEIMESSKIRIAPETTGKDSQFGSWEELLELHKEIGCGITFDFAHIWAREKGNIDFDKVLDKIKKEYKWCKEMHIHLSGIRYGDKGELNHLMLEESKLPWKEILTLLVKKGFDGVIICESPNTVKDALLIKDFLSTL